VKTKNTAFLCAAVDPEELMTIISITLFS